MTADALAADNVLCHFRWVDGDADTWNMLRDADSLSSIVAELARLCVGDVPDLIVGIEARGFVFAPMVALTLGVGFSPIRKGDAMFPGETATVESAPDYRGKTQKLSARTDHLGPGVRVALVDDWVETGSQAVAARRLIEESGAELVHVTVIVDEANQAARESLPVIRSIVSGDDLP
ncbi:MAG TPA: hypothetical protein H9786_13765 [Candidatus Brachybacterium merdavium]|uniref:Phosphoribosyltransferase domain-containing protein n=1 Tax=Candidatus Brachybacterium merdavium TaxID=2838513 RepID=A0A9D2LF64_9MICO|nr:hypothetical protein [Candidatus Brachybacterium merdavium]